MTEPEKCVLNKGLKFTPTPRKNSEELKVDIKQYTRKLRLTEYFYVHNNEVGQNGPKSLIQNKSSFNPQKGRNTVLDNICETLEKINITEESNVMKTKSNLNRNEENSLKSLSTDPDIIIKEADKGGAIVIMDKSYYEKKILDMLEDKSFYKKLPTNEDKQIMRDIKKTIQLFANNLTSKEKDYLTNFEFKSSNFYGLPKIHKSNMIKNAISEHNSEYIAIQNPSDLPFRPIVGSPNAPTQRLSNFLDIILKPLCKHIQSYVRDDLDFLTTLPKHIPIDAKLVTFDVVSLYTNIPHDLGLFAVKFWLQQFPNAIDSRFNHSFILECLKSVLVNNTFEFGNNCYKQIKGTAMGTKVAPIYANLTLGYLEIQLKNRLIEVWGSDTTNDVMSNWKRYLDDCFIIWKFDVEKLNRFHDILNDLDINISFTMEISDKAIPFLDILVIKEEETIHTDIYYKTTDTHQYLNFSSCHPRHVKRAIPYNLARRICMICSDDVNRRNRLDELRQFLLQQGYPHSLIDNSISKSLKIDRSSLFLTSDKKNNIDSVIPFVHTYNPRNMNILPAISHVNSILKNDDKTKEIFGDCTFINSKRQPRNLKRILCKSTFESDQVHKVNKCNDLRCGTCNILQEGSSYTFDGHIFHVNCNMSCDTSNVVYVITCPGCQNYYIGETGTSLRTRVRVHKQQILNANYRQIKLSEHLETCGRGNMSIFPFYKLFSENKIERKCKEKYFIDRFHPKLNS